MNARTAAFLAAFSAVSLTASSTFLPTPLQAQSAMVTHTVPHGWERVQQLPTYTAVDIRKDKGKVLCLIESVIQDGLTCVKANSTSPVHLARTEIKSIRLQNKGRSAGIGFVLGAGIGAGAGAAILAPAGGPGQWFTHTETAEFGAAVGVIIGGVIGALVGRSRDDFGTLVYSR